VVGLLLDDDSLLQARDDPEGEERPGHATRLLPLADALLAEAGLVWGEVERIAVGVGPGTFTGLRIGVATARGLAQSLGAELVGVSSLRALARAATRDGVETVLAVIDARRGEVFAAVYQDDIELIAPAPLAPAGLAELRERADMLAGAPTWTAVGDGAVRYRAELELAGAAVPDDDSSLHRVDGRAICELGLRGDPSDAQVVPDYRRRPDAEIALQGASS
jgi:tRNA threonylcarbamoyladenosine biosynthesis protein TsaB